MFHFQVSPKTTMTIGHIWQRLPKCDNSISHTTGPVIYLCSSNIFFYLAWKWSRYNVLILPLLKSIYETSLFFVQIIYLNQSIFLYKYFWIVWSHTTRRLLVWEQYISTPLNFITEFLLEIHFSFTLILLKYNLSSCQSLHFLYVCSIVWH